MGQSQSTIHAGERLIKIKNVKQRLDKETLVKLKSEFDRISEAGVSRAIFNNWKHIRNKSFE